MYIVVHVFLLLLQADFARLAVVNRVDMLGGVTVNCYVSEYLVMYSNTSDAWQVYHHSVGVHKVFFPVILAVELRFTRTSSVV